MRYSFLLNILDGIIKDAPAKYLKKYPLEPADVDALNQSRARAMIHLYLKVMFGLTEFEARERTVTDGGYDGGIDAYYIDASTKTIYLVQSKFRTTEANFESKEITLDELLKMDVERILTGQEGDEEGNRYAGKIKQLQREVSSIEDIARYRYVIVILANLDSISQTKIRTLVGGYAVEVFGAERTYSELVFPVISGTYFTASDIVIPIDLSNKNAGSKISYEVVTKFARCQITVLFVPAIEIAKIMHVYKNAVLKFNPRSYLDHEGKSVNEAIRLTVLSSDANELALYNNGITMLSEETSINERIGQQSKAQLYVKNPQIINGGQTSFTLSRIFSDPDIDREKVFGDKEIMLKVITVNDCDLDGKARLIDEISGATNRQTPVINADRFANDSFHKKVQTLVFDRFGALYERKRGEFSDGVLDGYVGPKDVIERNNFWRIYYASNGAIDMAVRKRLFQRNEFDEAVINDAPSFDRWYRGFQVYLWLTNRGSDRLRLDRKHYAMIYACVELSASSGVLSKPDIDSLLDDEASFWSDFMQSVELRFQFFPDTFPAQMRRSSGGFSASRYFKSHQFLVDLKLAVAKRVSVQRGFDAKQELPANVSG